MPHIIAVVGSKSFDEMRYPGLETLSKAIGAEIAKGKCWLLCGGLTGVMEAAARGAKAAGGTTIGVIPKSVRKLTREPDDEWANEFIDIAIFSGLGGGMNGRNQVIVNSCDVLIGLPGSNQGAAGTRSEINHAIKNAVPVVLDPYWATVIADSKNPDPGVVGPIAPAPPLVDHFLLGNAQDAVRRAMALLSHYSVTTTSRRKPLPGGTTKNT